MQHFRGTQYGWEPFPGVVRGCPLRPELPKLRATRGADIASNNGESLLFAGLLCY